MSEATSAVEGSNMANTSETTSKSAIIQVRWNRSSPGWKP